MKKIIFSIVAIIAGVSFYSCSDANEYGQTNTDNPSWISENYNDSVNVPHPESLRGTTWNRQSGLKTNAYGEEVQGFVANLVFQADADSVSVTMNEGATSGTWTDASNTEALPYYEYTYSNITGKIDILKLTVDEKGKVSKSSIFTGIAVINTKTNREILTICHYGDTPTQTYLVKQ